MKMIDMYPELIDKSIRMTDKPVNLNDIRLELIDKMKLMKKAHRSALF
ncbi:hypothetical protein MHZ92_09615 [Sporosarcina sp. ACRSL]|nr:hypothetical protein [Sporosarcina sp. ACRSL]MCG7344392.1 hypothetical protein [Sporosarcina sp. ACRSL]